MTQFDLKPFCADPEWHYREFFFEPFTRGDWTYATNGHVAVRVPRRDGFGENSIATNVEKHFPTFSGLTFETPPPLLAHSVWTGREWRTGLVNGVPFDGKYLCLISGCPNLKLSQAEPKHPLSFVFDGGEGRLMPLAAPRNEPFVWVP